MPSVLLSGIFTASQIVVPQNNQDLLAQKMQRICDAHVGNQQYTISISLLTSRIKMYKYILDISFII
jgi:hypothetical protein